MDILNYESEVIEKLKSLDDELFLAAQTSKEEVLGDEVMLYNIASDYRMGVEFGCDEEWSFNEAIREYLKISVPGHVAISL